MPTGRTPQQILDQEVAIPLVSWKGDDDSRTVAGWSSDTAYKMANQGRLPVVRSNGKTGRIWVSTDVLKRFLAGEKFDQGAA